MRALLAGWFSFEQMGASAGDLMARDLVYQWLQEVGVNLDIATAAPFAGGVDWTAVAPERYSHVVFVCGPFGNGPPVDAMLDRFAHCDKIGVNLSMLQDLKQWNPFDLLLERDSSTTARPDLVFLSRTDRVPVVGVILAHRQKEYGQRAMHDAINEVIHRVLKDRGAAVVPIDTRLDANANGLTTPAQVESVIAKMDAVVTTRLHGTVLAIKNGVPPVAIDPVRGGAKVERQATIIGWPVCISAKDATEANLTEAVNYCLTEAAREQAEACHQKAYKSIEAVGERLKQHFKVNARR
jgi:hypothetical protein